MTAQRYALHSKPMNELLLREQLDLQKTESYFPCIRVQPMSPGARTVKPYFPRYIFAYVDLEQTNLSTLLRWMPGAVEVVYFDRVPSSVSDEIIAAIRRCVDEIKAAGGKLFYGLKPGATVTIHDGPFNGYDPSSMSTCRATNGCGYC
jgi:transcriptional antiterminator RfaH